MNAWPIILGMAVVTYVPRVAGLWLRARVPPFWQRFLRFVPIAVFAALAIPALPGGRGEAEVRILAGVLASAVSWRFRKLWLGIAVGMVAYWGLR
ncbi:AzlD domain-containing protein [Stigmatella sp. ncwal1]|uniref:AzlD domain-containing protein n=1 Tax=Stigmatella ashevillensis TaxID=2995309 RepID=A0ABT5DGB6_9BACT|nr:AzlD domain-containing protein [Stigmatella ashevillena]MDC0712566.1 AzlD domain-containing protein [Stigmatella ashevillena]